MQMIIQPGIPTTSPAQDPPQDLRAASGLSIKNAEDGQNVRVMRKRQQDPQTSEFAEMLGAMSIISPVKVDASAAASKTGPKMKAAMSVATPASDQTANSETGSTRQLPPAPGTAVTPSPLPNAAGPTTQVSPKRAPTLSNAAQTLAAESSMIASASEQQLRLPTASGILVSVSQATSTGITLEVSQGAGNSSEGSPDLEDADPTSMSPKMLDVLDRIGRTSPQPPTARNSVAAMDPSLRETTASPVTVTASNLVDATGIRNGGGLSLATDPGDPASRVTSIEARKLGARGSESADIVATDSSSAALSNSATSQFPAQSVANPQLDPGTLASADIRPPLTAQVSRAVMEHIERQGVRQNDSLTVRLDPPELGEMTIQLSRTHEGLAVRVTAREAVTMDMLFARGQEIETQLRGQQLNLKSLEFLRTDMSGDGYSQEQQQNEASRQSEDSMNRIRRGPRAVNHIAARNGRAVTPDSAYGLSFRA